VISTRLNPPHLALTPLSSSSSSSRNIHPPLIHPLSSTSTGTPLEHHWNTTGTPLEHHSHTPGWPAVSARLSSWSAPDAQLSGQ
jgi:hypothetical protein